jgi:hypothetical protein
MTGHNGLKALQDFRTGILETGAHYLTSGLGTGVAGISGLLDLAVRGSPDKAAETVRALQNTFDKHLAYEPRGDIAQRAVGLIENLMEPVGEALQQPAERTFEETQNPALATGVLAATQGLAELLPGPNPARPKPRPADLARGPETTAGAPVPTKLGVSSVDKQRVYDQSLGDVDYTTDVLESPRLEAIAGKVSDYSTAPHPEVVMRMSPEEIVEAQVEMQRGNLEFLHDKFGDELGPEILEEAKLWYEGAHDIAYGQGARYGTDIEPVAAVYAALSPQQDWFKNVSLGDRVLDIYFNGKDLRFDKRMLDNLGNFGMGPEDRALARGMYGRKFGDLATSREKAVFIRAYDETKGDKRYRVVTPRGMFGSWMRNKDGATSKIAWGSIPMIEKAVSVLDDPSMQNISIQLGAEHKVRNFYNNIVNPWRDKVATADTHQVAAGQMLPLGGKAPEVEQNFGTGAPSRPKFGEKGLYALGQESLNRAGESRGRLAREMQSITWEAVRSLFKNKSARQQTAARAIWELHKQGQITAPVAREMLYDLAGGFDRPAWAQD